ncbi:hypothetical protein JKG47_07595 [Acidithiobacillus sp. MC6.1]|nr:hypothetical protein [Acidithiobacillus sp. MC6.1]
MTKALRVPDYLGHILKAIERIDQRQPRVRIVELPITNRVGKIEVMVVDGLVFLVRIHLLSIPT